MKIGRRSPADFVRRIIDPNNYAAVARIFAVHRRPFKAILEEVFSLGAYPRTVSINAGTGALDVRLHSASDLSTLNLIFCRRDYYLPQGTKVVVDIGSNIGLSALFWLAQDEGAFVYCYEPSPVSFERMAENLRRFQDRVSANRQAVSDFAGTAKLGLEASGVYSSLDLAAEHSVECQVVHINDVLRPIIERHGMIDVLKIDSEGHEIRTLKAIDPRFWPHIRCVNVDCPEAADVVPKEFHRSHASSAERFWR